MSRIGLTNLIEKNLIFHLNSVFLDAGLFETVSVGEENFGTLDMSVLIPVNEDGVELTTGSTEFWQSPLRNWVYESGVIVPSGFADPIVASGVTVNSVFKSKTDGSFGHSIDYEKGRITFDSAQSISEQMQAEFSFKRTFVKIPDDEDEIFLGRIFLLNPEIEKNTNTLPGLSQEMPLVLVEWDSHVARGLQLGGGRITDSRILIHILVQKKDKAFKKEIVDILFELDGSVVIMVDWNKATDPLDFNGDFAAGQELFSFKDLQQDNSVFFHKLYLDTVEPTNIPNNFGMSQAMIDINARVWLREF